MDLEDLIGRQVDVPRERLLEFYARLPTVPCKGLCHDSCGPVPTSKAEDAYLAEAGAEINVVPGTFRCSLLTEENKCSVYEHRPLLCRLFGAVKEMRCHFGCKPAVRVSRAAANAMLSELHGWNEPAQEGQGA